MSENEGGLGPKAIIAIGGLAAFGIAILIVASVNTSSDPEAPDGGASEQGPCFFPSDLFFGSDDLFLEPVELDTMIAFYKEPVGTELCPEYGGHQTIMVVEGLPGVSGVYSSREGNLAIVGWSEEPGGFDQTVGRCYVDHDHFFRTSIVHSADLEGGEVGTGVLTTIDVGTGSGGALAAVVQEVGAVTAAGGFFEVTHNYNPGSGAVTAEFDVWDKNSWTGVAIFQSTGEAETYNDRDFSPWTGTQYQGSPNYSYRITLICK